MLSDYAVLAVKGMADAAKSATEADALNVDVALYEEKYELMRNARFSLRPEDLGGVGKLLRYVDLTEDEARDMARYLKNHGTYTQMRAVLTNARRAGIVIEDDTPRMLSAIDGAVSGFADYCKSHFGTGGVSDWDEAAAPYVQQIENAGAEWLEGAE